MGPPTPESLAGMGLLGKKESIITEVLYLRDDTKRTEYFNKFYAANGGVDELKQVKWGPGQFPYILWHQVQRKYSVAITWSKNSSFC